MTGIRNLAQYTLVVDTLVLLEELQSRLQPQPGGCIHWRGPFHRQGYAMYGGIRITDNERIMFTVHRFLMKQKLNRVLDQSEMVIHTCSNFQCCNTDHMIVGSGKVRNSVMAQNGRTGPRLRGKHSKDHKKQNRKYRYTDAEMIWARYATKEQVAERYGISIERARQLSWSFRTRYSWLNDLDERYQAEKNSAAK